MESFDAFCMYIALQLHFSSDYDYHKYNGKSYANRGRASFETRKDKYYFHKLSKKSDPLGFVIANIVQHGPKIWVGDLVSNEKYAQTYISWLKRKESFSYFFESELAFLDPETCLKCKDGQYPDLLKMYIKEKIGIETIIVLDKYIKFLDVWNEKIIDTALWPEIYNLCKKYSPFVEYDKKKIKDIIISWSENG